MRVPLSWMSEYCDPGVDARALAEHLAMTGTEVERVGVAGPADAEGFVVGRVLRVDDHPDADRLRVCAVDTGDGERTIVCGAPNVAAGQTVVVALPGATMPGGRQIGRAKLRGVASEGMICSEKELEIGPGSDGIMVLEDASLPPGAPASAAVPLAEPVLELEVTTNRPDCLGVYGVAREVHAITGAGLSEPPWRGGLPSASAGELDELVRISVEAGRLCPRFTAAAYRGVKVAESPAWLKARLSAAGQRPINNVVDITNYAMLLTAQPMHAYDLDRISGRELIVRASREGETLETLDGIERELAPGTVVVCDGDGPTGIAGIMGGAESEVGEATTTVLMEAATWDGPEILRRSRQIGLRSEASARFEKQLHPDLTVRAQAVAGALMAELCGAEPVPGLIDAGGPGPAGEPIRLRGGRVAAVIGIEIDPAVQVEYLTRLGFEVEADGDDLLVGVPPDRHYDVTREIDLIEEVARVHDLDRHLPATLPSVAAAGGGGLSRQQAVRRRIEDTVRDAGFDEILSWSFTDPEDLRRLRIGDGEGASGPVAIANPLSEDQSVMRTTLLGSLLGACRRNLSRGAERVALFESGRVYLGDGEPGPGPLGGDFPGRMPSPVLEPHRLGAIAVGPLRPRSWRAGPEPADFFEIKGVLETLAGSLGAPLEVVAGERPFLHPGRSGAVTVGGREIGWIGQVHPLVERQWDLDGAVAFELGVAALAGASTIGEESYLDFTGFPQVDRDLAVVVPEELAASELGRAVASAGGELLSSVEIFDLYRGDQVEPGHKSLALRLRFRADDRTLTDEEVDAAAAAINSGLAEIGGRPRG